MTVHLLGFPFSETTADWEWCAFTSRTRDFATMLTRAGEEVILYAGTRNDAQVAELVPIVSEADRRYWWPDYTRNPRATVFNDFDPNLPGWREFNSRAALAIRERVQPGDILAITMGYSHKAVADALADLPILPVETGIGYTGVWAPYRVFESRAWQHFLAARDGRDDARFYDEVIPRAYDPAMFPAGDGRGGYYLYVGRLTARKGPHVAAEACRRLGARLVVAGQGVASDAPGRITATDGTVLEGDVEYIGLLGPKERAEVMGKAIAIFTPTLYFEPFGGVSVEAQLTGTPAIVSNWGGLVENIVEGETGFACNLLRDFVRGAEEASNLSRVWTRAHAIATWSFEAVAPRFDTYFDRLSTLFGRGWYT